MSAVHDEVLRQLEIVRRDFEARLDGMIGEITGAWEAARSTSDPAKLMALVQLVHRLAGNAGFFGMHGVSQSASALEQALDRWTDRGSPRESDFAELIPLIQGLRESINGIEVG
jgi:HPt (histidine-containing phosphotransfer) domain-containing protein